MSETYNSETFTSLQYEVATRMRQIADSFIEDTFKNNTVLCGNASVSSTNANFNTNQTANTLQEFVNSLMNGFANSSTNNKSFRAKFCNSTNINTTVSGFKHRNAAWNTEDTTYTTKTLDSTKNTLSQYFSTSISSNITRTVEISLQDYVVPDSMLESNLNKIRLLYSALDEKNYKNYVYFLKNPDTNTTNIPIKLINYRGSNTTDVRSNVTTIKNLINSLRGDGTLSTSTITDTSKYDSSTISAPSLDSNMTTSNKPPEAKSEDVYMVTPLQNKSGPFSLKDLPLGSIEGKNNTSYCTISFFAKMKGDADNATTADMKIFMTVSDKSGATKSYTSTTMNTSEEKSVTVTDTWQRFSLTRKLYTPTNVNIDIKSTIDLIKNDYIDSDKHVLYIAGLQADIQKEDSYGVLPMYRLPVFDDSKTNRIAIRRLLLLYELMATYYIAAYILYQNFNTNKQLATSLVNVVYDYMMNFNRNMIRQGVGTGQVGSTLVGTLSSGVATKISDFKKNVDDINIKSSALTTGQVDLKTRINNMSSEKDKSSRAYTYMIVAFVLFIIVVMACVIIFLLPIEHAKKVTASVGVASVGIIVLIIFNFIYTTKVENFQAYLYKPESSAAGLSISQQSDFEGGVGIVALGYASDYLDNTIQIALMVQTYIGYNNMNGALSREKVYYDEINNRIELSKTKVDSARNVYTLDRYTSRARVSFFVSIGILISLTIALLIGTSKYPTARPIILGVSGFILFLAILFYLLDTSARVRTRSDKIYWGTPNITSLG